MAPFQSDASHISHLVNPLATLEQLASSGSQLDGIPADLEDSIKFAGARMTQAAGILLRLPQDIIAQAIVTFTRFWVGAEGGSLAEYGAKVRASTVPATCTSATNKNVLNFFFSQKLAKDVSAASLYLTAKSSAHPKSPRTVLNVYAYLDCLPSTFVDPSNPPASASASASASADPESHYRSEGTYHAERALLVKTEAHVLRVLGFQTHVALPYALCINYLQTLDVVGSGTRERGAAVARRAFAHLNTVLLSPQLLYLTHQPSALATAAIYLAAREGGVKLPGEEWWEVFDLGREELGFLVVAMRSMEGWVAELKASWGSRKVPMTVADVQKELGRREVRNGGE